MIILLLIVVVLMYIHCIYSHDITQTNLLFIMFDDLRPELSIYGRKHMITPNFERLANRSVVFDNAYTHIAVCNPARDALLTGLRPDTIGTYSFQSSFRPFLTLPQQLNRMGYNTVGIGKILHWENNDRDIWSYDSWENDWYGYQNLERSIMNSSTMPDKIRPIEKFRDYEFTTKTIETMKKITNERNYWMVAIGYKHPHLAIHVPYHYYNMYKGKEEMWRLTRKELRFPPSSPEVSYRCCAEQSFFMMEEEGAKKSRTEVHLGDINFAFTDKMYDEMMLGYCAGVSFVDAQLGRLLDTMDELKLWDNTTIVLTADHGMHNGEKGIWEKWSLFDESTHVPLLISHPKSPNKGKHYREPVESIDVYATLNEILMAPYDAKKVCKNGAECRALQGKSLAPIILPQAFLNQTVVPKKKDSFWSSLFNPGTSVNDASSPQTMRALSERGGLNYTHLRNHNPNNQHHSFYPVRNGSGEPYPFPTVEYHFEMDFALSQNWRCAKKTDVMAAKALITNNPNAGKMNRKSIWADCDKNYQGTDEISVMGYSMRSRDFRYTGWFHYNRVKCIPILDVSPLDEELYDHRFETFADFTHLETVNLVRRPGFENIVRDMREKVVNFVRKKIVFRGPFVS